MSDSNRHGFDMNYIPGVPDNTLEKWQETVDLLAEIFDVPAGLIMKIHPEEIEVFLCSDSEGNPYKRFEKAELNTGLYCETVINSGRSLHVPNALEDPEWKDNPDVELNMISYLGFPLYWPDQSVFGTICVLDSRTREYNNTHIKLLEQFKEHIESDLKSVFHNRELQRLNTLLRKEKESLREEKERVNALNRNLEAQVDKRTAELSELIHTLQNEIDARNTAEAENRDLEQKLFQARKMEALGVLAGGVAHDFNNILSSILGFSQLSLDLCTPGSDLESYLKLVLQSGNRAAELVRQILLFARKSDSTPEILRADLILKEVVKLVRSSLPATIEIRKNIDCDDYVKANSTQLYQVFMNLLTNAIHAMKNDGDVLDIRMEHRTVGPDIRQDNSLKEGDYVRIRIADTGSGIPDEIIDSIFEPYFTTKETGEGTGLGLAVVHGIIDSYGGEIRVESSLGKGSVFTIHLPVCVESASQIEGQEEPCQGKGELILLVDDEPEVADAGSLLLRSLGYRVDRVYDSREALTLIKENPGKYDLLISDLMMPHMTGKQLFGKVRSMNENIPILVCSGYDKDNVLNQEHDAAFLLKPYSRADIGRAAQILLSGFPDTDSSDTDSSDTDSSDTDSSGK